MEYDGRVNRILVLVLCVASVSLAAKPRKKPAAVDAGVRLDAGTPIDAGVALDAGLPLVEAGSAVADAGVVAPPPPPAAVKWGLVVDEVVFHANAPMMTIDGKSTSLEAVAKGDKVLLRVPLETIDTGIGLRNSHMRNYLEATKWPAAELTVAKSLLKLGLKQTGVGTFSVHGVSREVTLSYDVVKAPGGLKVTGSFPINIKDFGIKVPSYMGITVKPDVKVDATFLVKD